MIGTNLRWLRLVCSPPSGKEAPPQRWATPPRCAAASRGEEAHDGVGEEPNPAVDQEVQREGGRNVVRSSARKCR